MYNLYYFKPMHGNDNPWWHHDSFNDLFEAISASVYLRDKYGYERFRIEWNVGL